MNRSPHSKCTSKLLVSVQNAAEAELALNTGVPWIDLKSPQNGPLGMPDLATAKAVSARIANLESRSVALGELSCLQTDAQLAQASSIAKLFPFAKVGLSDSRSLNWREQLQRLASDILPTAAIPVVYADFQVCHAPEPTAIIEFANSACSPFVLIDTYTKQGQSLLDYLDKNELNGLRKQLDPSIHLVVAGSLKQQHLPELLALAPFAFAVRGAVTISGRDSTISREKLLHWIKLTQIPNDESALASSE